MSEPIGREELDRETRLIKNDVHELNKVVLGQQAQLEMLVKSVAKTNELLEQSIINSTELRSIKETVKDISKRIRTLEETEQQRQGAKRLTSWLVANVKNILLIVGGVCAAAYAILKKAL